MRVWSPKIPKATSCLIHPSLYPQECFPFILETAALPFIIVREPYSPQNLPINTTLTTGKIMK